MVSDKELAKAKKKLDLFLQKNEDFGIISMLPAIVGPKESVLVSLRQYVHEFLVGLYPIRVQLEAIENSVPGFSTTPDTYRKFLREYMGEEYIRFLKNKTFLRKYKQILAAMESFSEPADQFAALNVVEIGGKRKISVMLEDYVFFINTYFERIETALERQIVDEIEWRRTIVYGKNGVEVRDPEPPAPKTFFNTIWKDGGENASTGSVDGTTAISTESVAESAREVVAPPEDGKVGLVPGVSADAIPAQFEIVEEGELPNEFKRWIDTDHLQFTEDFVYFLDRRLINAGNYTYKDNELIVCDTSYDEGIFGYMCYRYFDGKIYFLKNFTPSAQLVSFERQTQEFVSARYTKEFADFVYDEWTEVN